METKTIELKALVTQTIERTYKIEVPIEEITDSEDLSVEQKDLFKGKLLSQDWR